MEPRQLAGVVDRAVRHLVVPSLPVDADRWYDRSVPATLALTPDAIRETTTVLRRCLSRDERSRARELATALVDGEVTFCNRTVEVDGADGVDWLGPDVMEPPALWALKFHGFEFIEWAVFGFDDATTRPDVDETIRRWLRDWYATDDTRIGATGYLRRAWTPHAVSLRILNLSRYCAWQRGDERVDALVGRLVYRNASFLANHVEHDVGGNHLVENGAALVTAGSLFDDAGDEWLRQGLDVLVAAGDQFLADGGHFERSPMYHAITLGRYLLVVDLLRRQGVAIPNTIREVAAAATGFLRAIRPPDGRLPLLNDSVFGEAMELRTCLRFADAVGVDPEREDGDGDALEASGYYWLGDGADRLLVDGGDVGPEHLPAHSHNDQFSILFWADGRRVLTDTGTYEYAPTRRRQHARSVAAHNTVQYDDVEPIAVGGSYLMGRRCEPSVQFGTVDGTSVFDGSYRRRTARRTLYSHRRRVYAADDWWLVWDGVSAHEPAPVRSRLHVAHELTVEAAETSGEPRYELCADDGEPLAHVVPLNADETTVSTSRYFPEFGRSVTRPKVTLRTDGERVGFGFLLSTRRHDSVAVRYDGRSIAGLSIDGTDRELPEGVS